MIKCEYCETQFAVVHSRESTARFCTRTCQNRWIGNSKKGIVKPNPATHTPKFYRREAFKLFGTSCNRCGTSDNIIIHHKDENRKNNPIDGYNWEVLCRRCHQLHHNCIDKLPKQPRPKTFHKKKCPQCKTSFETTTNTKIFCSKQCWINSKITIFSIEKECPQCKEKFTTERHHTVFCGRTCSNKSRASI